MKQRGLSCSFCKREHNPETGKPILIKSDISGKMICEECIQLFHRLLVADIGIIS